MIRIAFLGTPEVALPALSALAAAPDIEIAAVVTNPDRPRGRSRTPEPPPVKVAALEHDLEVLQPERAIELAPDLAARGIDAAAIVAYGALLPRAVLETAEAGFVNLHFSLLPRWRGAAPVQHAIRAGDEVTGVTTFVLDEGMDTGPIVERATVPIGPDETAGSLLGRLAVIGAPVLVDSIRAVVAGAELTPQDDEGATLAPKIRQEHARIAWDGSGREVADLVRSLNPSPGAHTQFRGDRMKVWRVVPVDVQAGHGHTAGTVIERGRQGVVVACGRGAVRLAEVQPAGKSRMDGASFANGYQPEPGERLGP